MLFRTLISIVIFMLLTSCAGKDTIATFSNPDIQIMKFHDPEKHPSNMNSLFIVSNQKTVEVNVYNYTEQNGFIYSIGQAGFTKLDAKTLEFKQSLMLSDFNSKDIEIFNKLVK